METVANNNIWDISYFIILFKKSFNSNLIFEVANIKLLPLKDMQNSLNIKFSYFDMFTAKRSYLPCSNV